MRAEFVKSVSAKRLIAMCAKIICACYHIGGRANQGHLVDYEIARVAMGQSCHKHEPMEHELSFILCQFTVFFIYFPKANTMETIKGRLN